MSKHLAIAPAQSIAFLSMLLGWNGGQIPVYLDARPLPSAHISGSVVQLGERLARRAAAWDMDDSAQVEIGLPVSKPDNGGAHVATVLWAWCENRDQVWRAAKRFKPAPTMVLRMGDSCRRLVVWGLREPVPYTLAENANKRIAYALHAPQKYAALEKLRIPLPGTFLRVGRKRPAPVLVTRMDVENAYARSQVVARLKDPPPPYMQRLREGKVAKR